MNESDLLEEWKDRFQAKVDSDDTIECEDCGAMQLGDTSISTLIKCFNCFKKQRKLEKSVFEKSWKDSVMKQ